MLKNILMKEGDMAFLNFYRNINSRSMKDRRKGLFWDTEICL